jgi:hypothetical protein
MPIVHRTIGRFGYDLSLNMAASFIDRSTAIWTLDLQRILFPESSLSLVQGVRRPGTLEKGTAMRKTLMATAAVATLAVAAVAPPAHAQRGVGVGIAAGLIGGAIVGGAIASSNPYYYGPGYGPRYYGPGYGYYGGGPAYVAGGPYGGPCYWQRQRFWDGYGWRVRSVRVCG